MKKSCGFYHIVFFTIYGHVAHLGHVSDIDILYTHLFPLPIDASCKIWL